MEPKPYKVKYKPNRDRSIRAGLHGSFATQEEADAAVDKANAYFGGDNQTRAHVFIEVDENELELAKAYGSIDDQEQEDEQCEESEKPSKKKPAKKPEAAQAS